MRPAPEARAHPPRDHASSDSPHASAAATASSDADCLTYRDQELACDRPCRSIEPVLRTCADADASGKVYVHWRWDGTRTTTRVDLSGVGLDGPAACVEHAFARFVPCLGGSSGMVPLILNGWPR